MRGVLKIDACGASKQEILSWPQNRSEAYSQPFPTSMIDLFCKISNVKLIQLTILTKKVHLRCLAGSRMCLCKWKQHSSLNLNGDISLIASKDDIILIKLLYMKFKSVNCLSADRSLKQLSKGSVWWLSYEYLSGKVSSNYY